MGADIHAFLAIDDNTPSEEAPFTNDPSYWDLSEDLGLRGCKDYEFYAAIANVRNSFGKEPLITPRGLPKHHPAFKVAELGADRYDYTGVGWLTLCEIEAAMVHFDLKEADRPPYIRFVLDVMRLAERRYGQDRIRLIFGFSD